MTRFILAGNVLINLANITTIHRQGDGTIAVCTSDGKTREFGVEDANTFMALLKNAVPVMGCSTHDPER